MTEVAALLSESATEIKIFDEPLNSREVARRFAQSASQIHGGLDAVVNLISITPEEVSDLATEADVENFISDKLKKANISKIRIYASAQNILTFAKYPGYDPEVNYNSAGNGTAANRNLGLDYGSYPNAKSYTVGLNIGF